MAKKAKVKVTKSPAKLYPTPGYIVVEPQDAENKTAGGIYLPDSASEKPQKGVVIAVGDGEVTDAGFQKKPVVKVGDIVIYKKWGGNEVKVAGREYMFVKSEDILAVEK